MKIIAALRTKVDNDTNSVIASFVGMKVSPTSRIMKELIQCYRSWWLAPCKNGRDEDAPEIFVGYANHPFIDYVQQNMTWDDGEFCVQSKRCCSARYIFHKDTGDTRFTWFRRLNTNVKLCYWCECLRRHDEDSDEDSEEDSEEDNEEDSD